MGCRFLLLALLGCIPFSSFSQFNDDFSKNSLEGWIQSPSNRWSTTLDNINLVLHHSYDNSSSGRDYITSKVTVSSYENGKLTWRFRVKHGYSPSASNGWAFILASDADAAQLNASSPSRALVVGVNLSGSDDLLKIWEQTTSSAGSKSVKLIAVTTLNWETSIGASMYGYVEVVRNANGEWNVGYSKVSFEDITRLAAFTYTSTIPIGNLGVVYWYTTTADQKLWVDDVSLSYTGTNVVDKKPDFSNDTTSVISGVAVETLEATVKNALPESGVAIASFSLSDSSGDKLLTTVKSFDLAITSSKVDATKVIAGATLRVGDERKSCRIAQLAKDFLRIEVFDGALKVNEGCSADVSLGLYFKPEEFTDLGSLSFTLKGVFADSAGSIFSTFRPIHVNTLKFLVHADTLIFSKVPSAVKPNTLFDVTVKACDSFGNTDADYEGSCHLLIKGASIAPQNQKFSSGIAKFAGVRLSKSGEYSVDASSGDLKVTRKLIVADDDSYLKVSSAAIPAVAATSTSSFIDVLKFWVVDTGFSDTLCTRIAQLTLQAADSLGNLLSTRRVDSVKIFLNERLINFSGMSFTGGKVVLKFTDPLLVIPNRSQGEVTVKIRLSKQQQMIPFTLSVPTDGIAVSTGSSLISKTCSYPIRSSVIRYNVAAERILVAPHLILTTLDSPINLKCQISNREGGFVTSFAGKVSTEQVGFPKVQPILNHGAISIGPLRANRIGESSIRVVVNDSISHKALFCVVRQVDTLVSPSAIAAKMEGWQRQTLGGYIHSGGEGQSLLCYAIPPTVGARNTQWHLRFKLDNANFSSENYMRIVLLSDKMPHKDSSYNAVVLSYKKSGSKTLFHLENIVNGRVISRSDPLFTDRIDGKEAEAYLLKDADGRWSGDFYTNGYSCCHFENISMPFASVAGYSGVEYHCSSSNVGKMLVEAFDLVGSEQHLKILEGYYSSKGNAELTVNLPLSAGEGVKVTATDLQGSTSPVSNISAEGCKLHFRLGDAAAISSYKVKVICSVNGQAESDSANIHIRSGLELGDVTISEIMSDPSPSVGLPEVEYLELYNRVADTLRIDGWTIRVNGKTWRCNHAKINPCGYLAISSTSGAAALGAYCNAASVTYFDGLPNEKADIAIINSRGKVIATSSYSGDYLTKEGIQGGVSLEKIDVASMAECRENWVASKDTRGGTPGAANSVSGEIADTAPPEVEKVTIEGVNVVSLTFNEPVVVGEHFAIQLGDRYEKATFRHSPEAPRTIVITLLNDLEPNVCQLLMLSDVVDYSGNTFASEIQVALCQPPVKGDLIINEVLFNPEGECSDYVELVNASSNPIDLGEVVLCRRNAAGKLEEVKRIAEASYILPSQGYVLLCSTPEIVALKYPRSNPKCFKKLLSMPSYPNEGGVVVVADTALSVIDEFAYSEKMHFKMLPTFDGVSLERISLSEPKWQSASKESGYGTPGVENSQLLTFRNTEHILNLSSTVISPDGDGVNDYLAASYLLASAGTVADVDIFTGEGVPVKKLCRNELLGTSGTIVWDGIADSGVRASRGIYIMVTKLVYADGRCSEARQVFSVAYR
ncbi:lamin tail domain-containing protein [uncultured Acetobacteroides sp.]|uniref:lamin tail domain-containing protein n=1 Tax=uncultured Acetobacteroides sp. TaxID=1760811 RepID=UPI0029F4DAFC|nr:lamin tail domain-containing protein [uncultured Acetobacteroides sp.]